MGHRETMWIDKVKDITDMGKPFVLATIIKNQEGDKK
jgi:hypothetical protein